MVTRGGTVKRVDHEAPYWQSRVWSAQQKKEYFDVQKEKEVFLDAWHKFIDENRVSTFAIVPTSSEGSILEMPKIFKQYFDRNH